MLDESLRRSVFQPDLPVPQIRIDFQIGGRDFSLQILHGFVQSPPSVEPQISMWTVHAIVVQKPIDHVLAKEEHGSIWFRFPQAQVTWSEPSVGYALEFYQENESDAPILINSSDMRRGGGIMVPTSQFMRVCSDRPFETFDIVLDIAYEEV